MKATRQYSNLTIELEAPELTELFKKLAACDEVFSDLTCSAVDSNGKTHTSENVQFRHRTDRDGNDYFEFACDDGPLKGFKRRVGKHKKGSTLFPHSTPSPDDIPGLNGWGKYRGSSAAADDFLE